MNRIDELVLYQDGEDGLLTKLDALQRKVRLFRYGSATGAGMAGFHSDPFRQQAGLSQYRSCEDAERPEDLNVRSECVKEYALFMRRIAETAMRYGFTGNLWHSYLTYLLVYNENAYSRACEMRGQVQGGINAIALHDFEIFRQLFAYDFSDIEGALHVSLYGMIRDYSLAEDDRKLFNRRIRDRIQNLSARLSAAESVTAFKKEADTFYKEFGCGKFGLHKAFRIVHPEGQAVCGIVPITNLKHVRLDDLVGYEIQKKKLIENTEAFLEGRAANNCLLYGDAGTGKSTSIKGILNEYYDRGLRIIEVYRHQFRDLVDILAQVKNRNYRFIIYMDDLSFEENETDYKYLKAVIEGGLEKKPDNVLIYATSNRRHLIRENYADKEGDIRSDMHTSDTVQEKLSLSYRFGVTIYFGAPVKKEFDEIVLELAKKNGIGLPREQLLVQANAWELSHGGRSGRCAQQFIDHLLGVPTDEGDGQNI